MKLSFILMSLTLAVVAAVPPVAAQGPDGKALYDKNCRSCHGARGVPPAALAKQLKLIKWDAAYISARSEDSLVNVMKRGGKNMKAVKITPEEMKAVADYVKQMFAAANPTN